MSDTVFVNQLPLDVLEERVFNREPMQEDERPLACWDAGQFFHSLKSGYLISTHSLISWTKKEVQRYDFNKMTDICNVSALDLLNYDSISSAGSDKGNIQFRFSYEGKSVVCQVPANLLVLRNFVEQIPNERFFYHRTLEGRSLAKCSKCGISGEGTWFPLTSAPAPAAPFVFGSDCLTTFGCQDMFFEHLPNCHVFFCLKCLLALIESGNKACPSCKKALNLAERTLIVGHFPVDIKTRMSARNVTTKIGSPAVWSFLGFERPYQTSVPKSFLDLDQLQIPRDGCSLCMKGNTERSYAYTSPDFLKGKCQWPLCPECYELITDSRFKRITQFQKSDFLEPVEITWKPFFGYRKDFDLDFSFANFEYGRLFDKSNKSLYLKSLKKSNMFDL